MPATLEMLDSTIVALGAFNPAIFSPDWLEHNELIGRDDAALAKESASLIISRQVSVIETDWFALQVLEDRFTLMSRGAVTPAMSDLAVGIMSFIPQTPVSALGINFSGHYKFSSRDEYHKVGDTFGPKNAWNEIFPEMSVGLASLVMKIQPCKRDETPKTGDEINITLQESPKIRGGGVLFVYNDHRDINSWKDDFATSAECVAQLIDNNWAETREKSVNTFERLIAHALSDQVAVK